MLLTVEIALFGKNGTVNGDPLKRNAPEEKLRYDQGDKFGRTTGFTYIYLLTYTYESFINKILLNLIKFNPFI